MERVWVLPIMLRANTRQLELLIDLLQKVVTHCDIYTIVSKFSISHHIVLAWLYLTSILGITERRKYGAHQLRSRTELPVHWKRLNKR